MCSMSLADGQQALMEDEAMLGGLRHQAVGCASGLLRLPSALLCGAAGLVMGRRAIDAPAVRARAPRRDLSGYSRGP